MQKITHDELSIQPVDGVLLKKDFLFRRKKSLNLCNAAKNKASKIIAEAERDADAIRLKAKAEGYNEGVFALIDIFANFLISLDENCRTLFSSHTEALRIRTEELFKDNMIILQLIETWGKELPIEKAATAKIRMHSSYIKLGPSLREYLEKKGCHVHIKTDDACGCNIKIGDFVLELLPENFVQKLSSEVVNSHGDVLGRIRELNSDTCEKIKLRLKVDENK